MANVNAKMPIVQNWISLTSTKKKQDEKRRLINQPLSVALFLWFSACGYNQILKKNILFRLRLSPDWDLFYLCSLLVTEYNVTVWWWLVILIYICVSTYIYIIYIYYIYGCCGYYCFIVVILFIDHSTILYSAIDQSYQ